MKQKIVITGDSGMLGRDIVDVFIEDKKYQVFGISRKVVTEKDNFTSIDLDLTDIRALKKTLEEIEPDVIIHCAAVVDVDFCEKNRKATDKLHIKATGVLASYQTNKSKFIYISTDSVFDGKNGDYKESDSPHPLNYYASSKLKGEKAALKINPNSLIIRTNIYGFHVPKGNSLAEWALDNFKQNKKINGFNDVYFNPVYTWQLAKIIKTIVEGGKIKGILNIVSDKSVSKYDFLCLLAKAFYNKQNLVNSISVDELKFIAKRPKNTVLNINKLKKIIKNVPTVAQGIREMKKDYIKIFNKL